MPPNRHITGIHSMTGGRDNAMPGRGRLDFRRAFEAKIKGHLLCRCPFILEGTVKIDIFSLSLVRRNTTQRPFWAAPLLRRTSVFAAGENLGAGAALPTPSIEIPRVEPPFWAAEPKIKGHLQSRCPFILDGPVKIDILKSRKGIGAPHNRPSGRRRFCGVQAFSPKAKTLAEAEFISAEHLNHRRVERANGPRNPKQKDILSDVLSFWYGWRDSNPRPFGS